MILSDETFNERSSTVIAMAVTSKPQRAGYPLTLELENVGLPKRSWVKISQIRTLSSERLTNRIGHVASETMTVLVEGLIEIIGD